MKRYTGPKVDGVRTRISRARDRVPHLAWRATAAVGAAMLATTGAAGAAFADPAQHTNQIQTGTFTFDAPVVTCGGPTYTQTQNVTFTDYFVTTSGQTWHDRSTLSSSFTGTPLDPTLPTVTGTTEGTTHINFSLIGAAEEHSTHSRPGPTPTARPSRHTKLSISPRGPTEQSLQTSTGALDDRHIRNGVILAGPGTQGDSASADRWLTSLREHANTPGSFRTHPAGLPARRIPHGRCAAPASRRGP